jgi:rSAM/selenodomain-associated transferase 1
MKHLTVFARPPVPGRVKSRLSPALPPPQAARLYEAMLADTLDCAAACRADSRAIAWSEPDGAPAPPGGFAAYAQVPGDLGARLADAFDRAFGSPDTRVVVVGSDCPALRAEALDDAFTALETHEVVLGPAADGGYWLLGLSRPAPELFHDMPWSTGVVCERTLRRAAAQGLRVARLATQADMDTPADVAALVGECARGREDACGPRTREALRAMGLLP